MISFSKKKKTFCVVTGSRADFGVIHNMLIKLNLDKKINLKIIVTGSHLLKSYGMTKSEIIENNLKIYKKIKINSKNNVPHDISKSSSLILNKLSKIFSTLNPDLLIVLGDRYEMLVSSYVATLHKIPIAHIGGGEQTEGSYDNQFRHSISKMSSVHFVSHKIYKKRLINMGELPKNVFNFGSLALDNIKNIDLISKKSLEKKFSIKFRKINFLVTFHPLTLDNKQTKKQFLALLKAISIFKDYNFIFTAANADHEGYIINNMIKKFMRNKKNIFYVKSFGQKNYFSVLKYISGIIGNSSSGIIEVPSFKVGTINIGDRQMGRIKSKSVVNCKPNVKNISNSIKRVLSKKFQKSIRYNKNPFEKKNTIKNIKKVLKNFNLKNIKKSFHETSFSS